MTVGKMFVGMIYAVISLFVLAYLFYKDKFHRNTGYIFLTVSTILGFLIFAPMLPYQFQMLVLRSVGKKLIPVTAGLLLFIVLTFIFGRIFCGYLCPIGAIQELVYHAPVRKFVIPNKILLIVCHLLFFSVFIIFAVVFQIGIISYLGLWDFFHLNVTSLPFYVFLTFVILSMSIYRPFCRIFCPYGMLLSLVSVKSTFKLRREYKCIDCKKCEEACPTSEAGITDLKQECYLCNRCKDACPVGAIIYSRMVGAL